MRRSRAAEIMDDPGQSAADFDAALADLARINRMSFATAPLLGFLDRVVRRSGPAPGRVLSVLDVGAGGGDALRAIAAWGARRGVALDLWGLDRSPWAGRHAAAHGTPAQWITADLFDLPAGRRFDVVVCGLFAHHLDDATLVRFLRWLPAHARHRWLILDLHRHWLPWAAVWAGTRLLRMHPMVCHDGPISVARGFDRADWRRLVAEAGVAAEARWVPPFRWAVEGPGAG
ncbi:methyltransferase domain-containing protein [Falsiroseomonas selenitidurans]|uniref:Methyltransferase domain-containing protein n=1 Tax=Falsiroseomonas selenitidurans TaxID=2716335 RepID=A0ABX1E890_9PROT|nr:methyltransferase domain-containing protein [Falsiroseomonas selenitidurans]NKC33421.1 methyltransferase domain-containing protein [Falsiroseomonas selenitidurans]